VWTGQIFLTLFGEFKKFVQLNLVKHGILLVIIQPIAFNNKQLTKSSERFWRKSSNMAEKRAEYTNRIAPEPATFRELKKNNTPRYHGDTLRIHTGGKKLQVKKFIT
jgi:hypothetical protein